MQQEDRRTVRTFALASFLNDFGSDMIYPIWPLFVTALPGANMEVLGFIDGLGDAIVSMSQAGSGYVSDRTRRRKVFVWLGYMFGSLSRIGYAFSTAWQHLVPFKVLDRAGKMRGAPRDAIVADVSARENRGRNFGLLRTMDNLGAVCGIITAIAFLALFGFENIFWLFLFAAVPSLVAVLLVYLFVKEGKPADTRLYKGLRLKQLDRNYQVFLLLSSFFALGSFSYSFLLIYAETLGFQKAFIPVLYLVFTAVASLFSYPFGRLSDKIGRRAVLMLGFMFWGLVCLVFVLTQNLLAAALTFVLYGMHRGAIEPVQKTFVSELAPVEYRASVLGGFQMVVGLCALPSSVIAGVLWDRIGTAAPFYFSVGLTALSMVMLLFVKEKRA